MLSFQVHVKLFYRIVSYGMRSIQCNYYYDQWSNYSIIYEGAGKYGEQQQA